MNARVARVAPLLTVVALAIAAGPVSAQLPRRPLPASAYGVPWQRVNNEDRRFVRDILLAFYFATDLGRVAAQSGGTGEIRRAGAAMMRDNRSLDAALRALAERKGLKTPRGLDPAHTARLDRIVGLGGAAFERAVEGAMAQQSGDEIRACDAEIARGTDPDLRAFARRLRAQLEPDGSPRRRRRSERRRCEAPGNNAISFERCEENTR